MTTLSSQFGTASATLMRAPVSILSCFTISPPRPITDPIFLLLDSNLKTVSLAAWPPGAARLASGTAPSSSRLLVPSAAGGGGPSGGYPSCGPDLY